MRKDREHYNLLVIEDNLGDFILVRDFLEELIFAPEIDQATSFRQAIDLLSLNGEKYHAIFLDLSLPDRSGEYLIKEIVYKVKEKPVIVLTGYTDATFAIKSLALGASDYLLKDELTSTTLYKSLIYNIERNKNLQKLKESELRYSNLFHLSPQPMWVYDLETLCFLDVNEASLSHYGYTYDEFMDMTIGNIRVGGEDIQADTSLMGSEYPQSTFFQGLHKHKKKSGEIIDVDIRSNLILFKGKKAEMILVNDVTEKLKHIQIIEEQNKRLKEIAFDQSHVVRAPLTRMMGLINLIKETTPKPDELQELLGYIEVSAYEIDNIIREIVKKTEMLERQEQEEE